MPIKKLKFVTVENPSYGNNLKGVRIYYEGKKPPKLNDDGRITFGKNILEILQKQFSNFKWILTAETDSLTKVRQVSEIRTSLKTLTKMQSMTFDRNRDLKMDIIRHIFAKVYPGTFKHNESVTYKPGILAKVLKPNIIKKMSQADKEALNSFIPGYTARESVATVNVIKASSQIKTLKEIAKDLLQEIGKGHSESWWQSYLQNNILIIQQGYIHAIEKMNIAIGDTKYPDFILITHDGFLDILEIKKPSTNLLKLDDSRGNYFWDTEISKAIIQVENYIEYVSKNAETVRGFIKDKHGIDMKVVRPRGSIIAGDASQIAGQKMKDDFRLLTLANRNIAFVTYDELSIRLKNYVSALQKYSSPKPEKKKPKSVA